MTKHGVGIIKPEFCQQTKSRFEKEIYEALEGDPKKPKHHEWLFATV